MIIARLSPLVLAIAALVALATVLLSVSTAEAHARYESSIPDRGEVLETSPDRVEITFTQNIQRITDGFDLSVSDSDGTSVTAGEPEIPTSDRSKLTVALQPDLVPGRYVVEWLNTSDEDGHEGTGAYAFYVGVEPTADQLAEDEELAQIEGDASPTPDGGEPTTTGTSTESPVDPSPAATPSGNGDVDGDDDDADNTAALVVLIIIGGVLAGIAAIAGVLFVRRNP